MNKKKATKVIRKGNAETTAAASNMSEGVDMLTSLMKGVTSGHANGHEQLLQFITAAQTNADAIRVGHAAFQASRMAGLAGLINLAEDQLGKILRKKQKLPAKDLARVLSVLYSEKNSVVESLAELSRRPPQVSPDKLARVVSDDGAIDTTATPIPDLQQRKRIMLMLEQITRKTNEQQQQA